MSITLEIPPDNHRAIIHAVMHIRRRRDRLFPHVMAGILLTVALVLFVLTAVLESAGPLVGALVALLAGMSYLSRPRRIRAVVDRRMAQLPEYPRTTTITDTGVSTVSAMFSSSFEWAWVTSAVETEEVFVLRRYRTILSVLPKSAFGPGQADELRALLTGHHLLPA